MADKNRFKKLLRLSDEKVDCLKAIQAISQERSKLPNALAEKFESGFGIDLCIVGFMKEQFSLDLASFSNKEEIIEELVSGDYSDENPVLALEDGDLIIDQISSYSETSVKIRNAFNVPLDIPLSENELLPCEDVSLKVEHFFAPIYDADGDVMDNAYIQVDMQSPILPVTGENQIFTNLFTHEINDLRVTVFSDGKPVGMVNAALITSDKSAFGAEKRILSTPSRFRNSVLLTDAELYSQSLQDSLQNLCNFAEDIALEKNLNASNSVASEFFIPSMSTERRCVVHINDIDFQDDFKQNLTGVLDSMREIFEDPSSYHLDTYSQLCDGYNPLIWQGLSEEPVIMNKKQGISERLRMSGLSAFVSNHSFDWWYDAMASYTPCDLGSDFETLVIIADAPALSSVDIGHCATNLTDIGTSIDQLLLHASTQEDDVIHSITKH